MEKQIVHRCVGMNEEWLCVNERGVLIYTICGPETRKAGAAWNTEILSVSEAKGKFAEFYGQIDEAIRTAADSI